ncbi:MAG: lactate utilization protein B [Verrucomicrobiales bacterium]
MKAPLSPAQEFQDAARLATGEHERRTFIRGALHGYERTRESTASAFVDWEAARRAAEAIKSEAIDHLDRCLTEFERKFTARGGRVFWASTGKEARDYIVSLAREHGVRSVIKSKTMTGDEIELNEGLEAEGFGVVESDLGEFIQQLKHEAPYHFVFPCMHLKREEIRALFEKELGSVTTESPEELTLVARRWLRRKYLEADMGISGANFIVADSGMISITENEGNARLTCALPRIHVALVGIEKVVPRLADLALFLPMLATAGTGQHLTCYNSMYGGPRQPGETDGPEEFHVILLDNHRTRLLADAEQRDALHCIRCGACLNVCPIFKNVGGHAYGTPYQGPIGSVITPHLRGLQSWAHLSAASSLCGACTATCPVRIDLHHHLLRNRRNAVAENPRRFERLAWRAFAAVMTRPRLLRFVTRVARRLQPLHRVVAGTLFDPLRAWTGSRFLPALAGETFSESTCRGPAGWAARR